ncbi:hypothetical protein [Bacillus altitudinis]|nr:hypothetical protein [Bacillus altitudinis]
MLGIGCLEGVIVEGENGEGGKGEEIKGDGMEGAKGLGKNL